MPTVSDFLNAAGNVALLNGVIYLAGRGMICSMKRKGFSRRAYHGWYVWVWMMGGVMVGGLALPWQTPGLYQSTPILVGFLLGWIGGTFYGAGKLTRYTPPVEEVDPPEEE